MKLRVKHPVLVDREVIESLELRTQRARDIADPKTGMADALDDEESQCAACKYRGLTARIGSHRDRGDDLTVVGDIRVRGRCEANGRLVE